MNSEIVREGVTCGICDAIDDQQNRGNLPTLRDRFAMAALDGMLASDTTGTLDGTVVAASHFAQTAYALADAMLVAREAKSAVAP